MRHNGLPYYFRENFVESLKRNSRDHAVLYAAFRERELLGVGVCIRGREALCMHAIGIRPEEVRRNCTYFTLGFYRVAEDAPRMGVKLLYYGSAAYKAKVWRGCEVTPTAVYYKTRSALKKLAVRPYFAVHRLWWRSRKIPPFVKVKLRRPTNGRVAPAGVEPASH